MLLLGAIAFLTASSCEKEDPVIPNEEEIITTLTLTLTPDGGGDAVVLSFKDLDGEGGNDPVVTGGTLSPETVYNGTLSLLNETTTPAEDITEEIREEDEEHQFFFQSSQDLLLTSTYLDFDSNNQPVGLSVSMTTGQASTGQLTVILRHEPAKSASGVADGDPTNAGGETDIEVAFDITIE